MPDRDDASRPAPTAGSPGRPDGRRGFNIRRINLLLLLPLIGVLVPQFYNRRSPELGGLPFFYWYQLLWIPISVVITYVVYRATRGER